MITIRYRRASTVHPNHPVTWDYQAEVDGEPVAHVFADVASRQSGTTNRWRAYNLDGERISYIHSTFGRLKEELAHHFATSDRAEGQS
jgi:hypothetical protein